MARNLCQNMTRKGSTDAESGLKSICFLLPGQSDPYMAQVRIVRQTLAMAPIHLVHLRHRSHTRPQRIVHTRLTLTAGTLLSDPETENYRGVMSPNECMYQAYFSD